MAKAKRQMQEDIKLIDVVVELVDARIPNSSKNPEIDTIAKGKSRVILLNKADMADPAVTALWKARYEKDGFFTALVNSRSGSGVKTVEVLGEDGQYAAQSQVTGTRGSLVLNKDTGRLSWTEETEGSAKDMAFAKKS